jgi:sec-independent protein translocase protein TatA
MPFGIGQWELLILVAVLVLIFGTSKVPRIARELGGSIREMKKTMADVDPRTPLRELEAPPAESEGAEKQANQAPKKRVE